MDESRTAQGQLTLYAVVYASSPGSALTSDQAAELQHRHVAYQEHHFTEGRLVMGGPYAGIPGGMALFNAASQEEVERITAGDPAVAGGLYVAEVRPWIVVLNAYN